MLAAIMALAIKNFHRSMLLWSSNFRLHAEGRRRLHSQPCRSKVDFRPGRLRLNYIRYFTPRSRRRIFSTKVPAQEVTHRCTADATDAVKRRLWKQCKYQQAKRRLGTCSHPNLGVTRVIAPRSRRAQAWVCRRPVDVLFV
jgi:hypothetical protein